jgi:Serine aminopeptidase, S33
MGGMIAQALAIRRPDRVRSLTCISSTPSPDIGRARPVTLLRLLRANPSALADLRIPTLVLHGQADRLIRSEGGRALAAAIPGATLVLLPGMGHDLPQAVWPTIIGHIRAIASQQNLAQLGDSTVIASTSQCEVFTCIGATGRSTNDLLGQANFCPVSLETKDSHHADLGALRPFPQTIFRSSPRARPDGARRVGGEPDRRCALRRG